MSRKLCGAVAFRGEKFIDKRAHGPGGAFPSPDLEFSLSMPSIMNMYSYPASVLLKDGRSLRYTAWKAVFEWK